MLSSKIKFCINDYLASLKYFIYYKRSKTVYPSDYRNKLFHGAAIRYSHTLDGMKRKLINNDATSNSPPKLSGGGKTKKPADRNRVHLQS